MITYIRENYPEKFNDYIESSEFIAIIELLAYLSQNLAFRVDLNTRENFLATAESRESVLRLAKMLDVKHFLYFQQRKCRKCFTFSKDARLCT